MGFGVQECGEEVSVFTWIPENLSGRAVGVPLGVCVCLQHHLGLGGAGDPYPEQGLGLLPTPVGGEMEEKTGKSVATMRPFPGAEGHMEMVMNFGLCQTSSPCSFGRG